MAPKLIGRWHIDSMDLWDLEAVELIAPAFIEIHADGTGSFRLIAVEGFLDVRFNDRATNRHVEFSWDGYDECDPVSGRGWAQGAPDGSLNGHIFFHLGDESGFHAVR